MNTRIFGIALAACLLAGASSQPVYAAGEGSLLYNLAAGGSCYKLTNNPAVGLLCGYGATFAEYVYTNRRKILYLLAWSGGKMAKVTTPCVIANGVRYYCL